VIHEFYASGVGKLAIPAPIARSAVDGLIEWRPLPPLHATIRRAWYWCDTAQINFWDALILAAAEQSGCRWLLSEDFQPGRQYGTVTVVNPFAQQPADF
jgi:predicted nucleic acid-binding protein